jgi:hypothetical protein
MRTRQLASNTVQGQVRAWIGNYKRLRHIYSLTGDHRLNKFRQCYCNILVYKNRILEITMSRRKSLRVIGTLIVCTVWQNSVRRVDKNRVVCTVEIIHSHIWSEKRKIFDHLKNDRVELIIILKCTLKN